MRDAIGRHDWHEAFERAQSVRVLEGAAEAERLDLLADAAWWLGRLDDCIEAREAAYLLYEEAGDRRRAGQCAVWLSEHHLFRNRPAIAGAWLRRARNALGEDHGCCEHGALLLREAELAHGRGDLASACSRARSVIELGRRLGSVDLEAEALQTLGRVLIDQGDPEEGLAAMDEAMLLAVERRLGPYSTGKVYCSLISACEDLGDLRRAAEWTDATARWSEQHPFAIFPGICRVHHAVVLKQRGSLEDAEAAATRAGEELLGSHLPNAAAAYTEIGDIRRRLGQLDEAEAAFAKARELSGAVCGGFALLRLAQGRVDEAREVIDRCMEGCGTTPLSRAKVLPMFVHISLASGDTGAASEAAEELETIAATYGSPLLQATARSSTGRLQLASHDPQALPTLAEAQRLWEELDVPYEVATTRTLVGAAQRDAGDEAAARESFARAAVLFENLGAQVDAERALGGAPAPSLPAGLTPREAEVLALVASGMTNNEIAEALYLSAKTVSRHLSNIFTKVGVSSRTAATAFAFQHGLADP